MSVYGRRLHTVACNERNSRAGTFLCCCDPADLAAMRAREAAREAARDAELLDAASRAPWLRRRTAT